MREKVIHSSHEMTEWRTEIRCPCDTPRFYGVRSCKLCNGEELSHPAGHFVDEWLYDPCVPEEENEGDGG